MRSSISGAHHKPMNHTQAQPSRRRSRRDLTTMIMLAALIVVAILIAVVAFNIARNLFASWTITDIGGAPVFNDNAPTSTPAPGETALPTLPVINPGSGPEPKPWDGKSRVTVLVMGLDYRDWEAGDTPRTDTMILMTLDPVQRTAGILSIPRDLWVNIPNYGYHKINQAYYFGELDRLPEGGPGLAMDTVEQVIGVPVDYFAQIDFGAFVRFIDEIKGVKLDITEEIVLDPIGPNNKERVLPGNYVLNGDLALAYARHRKTAGGDFDRAQRQQQVILAIYDRVMGMGIGALMEKAPALYQELSAGVRTNLSLEQVISLGWTASQISKDRIITAAIGSKETIIAKSDDGLDILIPIPDKIRLVRDEVFSTGGSIAPAAEGKSVLELAKAEGARISVQNGTATGGLATRTGDYLKEQGLNVVEVRDANDSYFGTTLFIYNAKPYTARFLAELMKIPNSRVFTQFAPQSEIDIAVMLGNDWREKNPLP